ncbi:MAG: DUF4037 domain-containing protein [Eubacterium sp.]|nr:DUF4037 domain-containing protein [Eubacterium sp.]
MNGLKLSETYYLEMVAPEIKRSCPKALSFLAAGLVGEGSECFGFDDEISQDHDFGPRVCLWLTEEGEEQYGEALRSVLEKTKESCDRHFSSLQTKEAAGRSGVLKISEFYQKYTGKAAGPGTWQEWIKLPQEHLATCTNGAVFWDAAGEFTAVRKRLLGYYPEDVRIKKIVAKAALAAQAGQYNFERCLRRGEQTAATMALGEFLKHSMELVYLLNRTYMPYYKWSHRGLYGISSVPGAWEEFNAIVRAGINAPKACSEHIEVLCTMILKALRRQKLCSGTDPYLLAHTEEMTAQIKDPAIRALPVMFG